MAKNPPFVKDPHPYAASSFLTYYYDNSDAMPDIERIRTESVRSLMNDSYQRFKSQKHTMIGNLLSNGSSSEDISTDRKILELFDYTCYTDSFKKYWDENAKDEVKIDDFTKIDTNGLEEAVSMLTKVQKSTDTLEKQVEQFNAVIQQIFDTIAPKSGHKGVINKMKKAIIAQYCERAQKENIKLSNEIAKDALVDTEIARMMLKDILGKTDGDLVFSNLDVKVGKNNQVAINNTYKKLLVLAIALPSFKDGNFNMGDFVVRHGSDKDGKTYKGDNVLLEKILDKTRGYIFSMKGHVGEVVSVYGPLKAHVQANVQSEFEKALKVKPKVVGSDVFQTEITPENSGNTTFLDALKSVKNKLGIFENQVSKADGIIEITNDGVVGHAGFSVKTNKSVTFDTNKNSANINIQEGTSLLILMGREMRLNSHQYRSVMQLLAGHPSDTGTSEAQLQIAWQDVKKKMAYLAFVDALTGSTLEGKAHFLVIRDRIYAMENIIEEVMKNGENGAGKFLTTSMSADNPTLLTREPYLAINDWIGDENDVDESLSVTRGLSAFQRVSQKMYQAKIKISLNIHDLARFNRM